MYLVPDLLYYNMRISDAFNYLRTHVNGLSESLDQCFVLGCIIGKLVAQKRRESLNHLATVVF